MVPLSLLFKNTIKEKVFQILEQACEKNKHECILGQTISISYEDGLYYVCSYNIQDKSVSKTTFRHSELSDAVSFFFMLYDDDLVGAIDDSVTEHS